MFKNNGNNRIEEKSSSYLIKSPTDELEDEKVDEAKTNEKQISSRGVYEDEERVKSSAKNNSDFTNKNKESIEKVSFTYNL